MKLVGRTVALSCVVLLSLPLLATAGPAPSVPEWQNLEYLQQSNGWFRIISNHETFGGTEIPFGVATITPNNPGPTEEEGNGINLEVLWGAKCQKVKEQTVTLSRKVYLPGHPASLQVSLWAYNSSDLKHPLSRMSVKVNGASVRTVRGAAIQTQNNRTVIELTSADGDSFKYGENTITFEMTKKETKKKKGYCTTSRFGGAFELAGTFQADMSSTIPTGISVGDGSSGNALLPMTITNHGPSHLPAGTFPCDVRSSSPTGTGSCGYPSMFLWAISETATVTTIVGLDGTVPRPDCHRFGKSVGNRVGYTLTCSLPPLGPGDSLTITLGLQYENATADSIIYFGYGAPGYGETTETRTNDGELDREMRPIE